MPRTNRANEILQRLEKLRDARTGVPVQTHRRRLAPLVVGAKSAFRRLCQPLLNEALHKQSLFNDAVLDWMAAAGAPVPSSPPKPETELDEIRCELPVELLFSEGPRYVRPPDVTADWDEFHARWADLPLGRLLPHLALFDFFLQRRGYPGEYVEWYEAIHRTRGVEPHHDAASILNTRYHQFVAMERALVSGGEFFRQHPVRVELNPRGYFNVRDGHHRAIFLLSRGRRRLPVVMSRHDHQEWLDHGQARLIADRLHASSRLVYTPILAEPFYDYPSERDGIAPSRLDLILRHLGAHRLDGRSVLDIGCNVGFYAQHFAREGARVTAVERDPSHVGLLSELNALFRTPMTVRAEQFEEADLEPHDVVLMLTVFYHFLRVPQTRDRFLAALDRCVGQRLYWESGDDPESEKALIREHTRLKRYEKLGDTVGTGKVRELGVFMPD